MATTKTEKGDVFGRTLTTVHAFGGYQVNSTARNLTLVLEMYGMTTPV